MFHQNEKTVDQHNYMYNNVCLMIDFEKVDKRFHNIRKYWPMYIVLDTSEDNDWHMFEHWYKLLVVQMKHRHKYKYKHLVDWHYFH